MWENLKREYNFDNILNLVLDLPPTGQCIVQFWDQSFLMSVSFGVVTPEKCRIWFQGLDAIQPEEPQEVNWMCLSVNTLTKQHVLEFHHGYLQIRKGHEFAFLEKILKEGEREWIPRPWEEL